MKTYPETRTFSWEEKPRLPMSVAYEIVMTSLRQKGSDQRKAAYIAVRQALELIQHEHDPDTIPTSKLKQLLIAAAQEHEWFALDMKKVRANAPPMPKVWDLPEGMRCCRKCREIKPKDDFKADPSPAKARRYGWSEDTTQKVLSHLWHRVPQGQPAKDGAQAGPPGREGQVLGGGAACQSCAS